MQKITIDYTATATNSGGRNGHVRTDDGQLDFDVAFPKEIGGPGGKTNPEQFFAAAYASCFGGALGSVANGVNLEDAQTKVMVHLGKTKPTGFGLAVDIEVSIPQADSLEAAQKLVELAHQHCPFSKAVRGNIEVKVKAV
ncbi:organic hydroperoxide resistance protein [Pararhodonellum marinum]|uniref:organic hydroperoxide resistance protein n=1 Tax=Pararhodonellum marinum TaxID=2755358 RepID=UPI00189002ED|nr:organic hydroperoxide resistance protein [Pararhodonellum marinum]